MNTIKKAIVIISILISSSTIFAASYSLPSANDSIIGSIQYIKINNSNNLASIAKQFDIGYNSIINANPQYRNHNSFPIGSLIKIPTVHLLPGKGRNGIVVNLPEMRIYFYNSESNLVDTYPIGIGKVGRTIPIKNAVVTYKKENPTWTPPQSIREFNQEKGIILPDVMPAGPDNPLGKYAIYMSIPTYLMHSTIFPESVGKRASFGCLRMYESDIETLFPSIKKGIPIFIINNPIKTGWHKNKLYVEAYQPLEEHMEAYNASLPGLITQVINETKNTPSLVDWQAIYYINKERDGIPHDIAVHIATIK